MMPTKLNRASRVALSALAAVSMAANLPSSASAASTPPRAAARVFCNDSRHIADPIFNDPGESRLAPDVTYIVPMGGPYILASNVTTAVDSQYVSWMQSLFELRVVNGVSTWVWVRDTPWVKPYVAYDNTVDIVGGPNGWSGSQYVGTEWWTTQRFGIDHAGSYRVAFRIHWYPTSRASTFDAFQWADEHKVLADGLISYDRCAYEPTSYITLPAPF
jgi:hypothetical protein